MSTASEALRAKNIQEAHHHLITLIASSSGGRVVIPASRLQLGALLPAEGKIIAKNATLKYRNGPQHNKHFVTYDDADDSFTAVDSKSARSLLQR